MTFTGGTSAACAACKHQRRGCKPDCPLAPYFPADEQVNFQRVHKLFGVNRILNTLESLDDDSIKSVAINAMIFEAYMRHNDPILGSYGLIMYLREKIKLRKRELHAVLQQLAKCRQNQYFDDSTLFDDVAPSQPEVRMEPTQDDITRPPLNPSDDAALWNTENAEDYYASNATFIPTRDDAWLAPLEFNTEPMLEDITCPPLMPVDDPALWNNENAKDNYASNATFIPTQDDAWLEPPDFETMPMLEDVTCPQPMPIDDAALWNNENAEDYYAGNATFIPTQDNTDDAWLGLLNFDTEQMLEDIALWNNENAEN